MPAMIDMISNVTKSSTKEKPLRLFFLLDEYFRKILDIFNSRILREIASSTEKGYVFYRLTNLIGKPK